MDLPRGIQVVDGPAGLPLLRLESRFGTAEISNYAAHILGWRPAGHEEVLFVSPAATFLPGTPIRGGVPVVFPWFGAHAVEADHPMHGFARRSEFELEESTAAGEHLRVVLGRTDDASSRQVWPHPFQLRIELELAEAVLRFRVRVTNTGAEPFRFSEAMHSYFAVSDVRDITVEGLQRSRFLDKPHAYRARDDEEGPIRFGTEVDRVYERAPTTARIIDPGLGRAVQVHSHGAASKVVWNPGPERGSAMTDLGPDGWQRFVCVETGNVHGDDLDLAPGAEHVSTTELRVTRLD